MATDPPTANIVTDTAHIPGIAQKLATQKKDNRRAKGKFLPRNIRTPLQQRKERAKKLDPKIRMVITKEMTDALSDDISRLQISGGQQIDIIEPLSELNIAEKTHSLGTGNSDYFRFGPDQKPRDRMPFILRNALPKSGMKYEKILGKHGNLLLFDRPQHDSEIVWALWDNMPNIDEGNRKKRSKIIKYEVEQLIIPVFDLAKCLVEDGRLPSACNNEIAKGEEKDAFRKLISHVHRLSNKQWVRRLSLERFIQFFTVLADACDKAIVFPEYDGSTQGFLVNCITKFLEAAVVAGTTWVLPSDNQ